jgi:hypothetical protein
MNISTNEDQKYIVGFGCYSEAFDKVLHNGIFEKVLDKNVRTAFVHTLNNSLNI